MKLTQFLHTNSRNWFPVPLRLAVGLTMAAHGAQKLFGWFGGYGLKGTAGFFEQTLGMHPGMFWAGLASSGEFLGGLLLLIGLATRFASLTTAIVMAVAVWAMHAGGFFAPNGIELPLSLLAGSLALLVSGGGALSFDAATVRVRAD